MRQLFTLLILLVCAGCGQIQARVLDDLTGRPVAGATVTPVIEGIFGPYDSAPKTTDDRGRVKIFMGWRRLYGLEVTHPHLRQVYPEDKPKSDGKARLVYLRRPPRVVLLLPEGFSGPIVVTGENGNQPYREEMYRVAVPDDTLQPIQVPGIEFPDLVCLEEIEAERGGVTIRPSDGAHECEPVCVWVSQRADGMFYENDFVHLLYVGTANGFQVFERGIRERMSGQGLVGKLDRCALAELSEVARIAEAVEQPATRRKSLPEHR